MAVQNSLTRQAGKPKFTAVINSDSYKRMINSTLGDPRKAARFVTAITSAVSANPALQECDASTIVSAGLLGEGLNLSPSPQLGQYYFVPYKQKAKYDRNGNLLREECTLAQFQLGYKGYIQLAIRSGQYKKLNVLPIKQGELIAFDPLEEEIEVRLIDDEIEREKAPTIGYYAMFEYTNGFKKAMYWSKEKMLSHADKYSAAFSLNGTSGQHAKVSYADYEAGKFSEKDAWKYSSFWYKDFDSMACKTMLRQLISKWGIMSIDMQTAISNDMGVIREDGSVDYIDTPAEDTQTVQEQEQTVDIPPEAEEAAADFAEILEG